MPLRIVYSHNKKGLEARQWDTEIRAASDPQFEFLPFNHGPYASLFMNAGDLDLAYRRGHAGLSRLYADLREFIGRNAADVLFVTNCPQYHPDFLLRLPLYKVLYSTDDTAATYRRTIPYLHAYDHVMFCDPVYDARTSMKEKMLSCGARNADWLPLGVFDFEHDSTATEDQVLGRDRDVDLVYVGNCFLQKLPLLSRIQRAFGSQFVMRGMFTLMQNAYSVVRHGARRWVRPISNADRVMLYQRARIGFNIHWDDYSVGNQRLYHLPANGVMQISDCPDVERIYDVGTEIDVYRNADDLIDRIRHYLERPEERLAIARAGYRRTMAQYRIRDVLRRAATMIERGMRGAVA